MLFLRGVLWIEFNSDFQITWDFCNCSDMIILKLLVCFLKLVQKGSSNSKIYQPTNGQEIFGCFVKEFNTVNSWHGRFQRKIMTCCETKVTSIFQSKFHHIKSFKFLKIHNLLFILSVFRRINHRERFTMISIPFL